MAECKGLFWACDAKEGNYDTPQINKFHPDQTSYVSVLVNSKVVCIFFLQSQLSRFVQPDLVFSANRSR
jgi:hypothetical protein